MGLWTSGPDRPKFIHGPDEAFVGVVMASRVDGGTMAVVWVPAISALMTERGGARLSLVF